MPSSASPFGLRPAYHPSGRISMESIAGIISGYTSAIYQYSTVKIGTDGTLQLSAAGERCVGVFLGCTYVDSTGRPVVTNQWVANTTYTAGSMVAYYTRDQNIIYEIQSITAVDQADVGNQADWIASGNATTGLSTSTLSNTRTSSGSAGLRILGFGKEVDNAPGDTYTNVYVQISEHQDVADLVGYGG